MSIASEIQRLQQAKADLKTAIEAKGVTVPAATTIDGYAALVDSIQQGGSSLPYDAEIDYIETDGQASINTRIYPTSLNIKVEYYTRNNMEYGWMYNTQANNTWIGSTGKRVFWKNYNASYRYDVSGYNDDTWNTWKYDMQNGFYKNGTLLKSFTASLGNSQISTMPLYIGNMNDRNSGAASVGQLAYNVRIGWCKIYSGNTLVRDYIPVRVGQIGYLYDNVSGELFCNAGTGSFVLGADKN